MKYIVNTTAVLSAVLALGMSMAVADVPQLINYQGRLTDNLGAPLDTTVQMIFTIYNDVGLSKWQETHPSVTVTNGLFNVLLGSVTGGLVDAVFEDTSRYLGIKVGTDPEITPRTRLVTAPYGMRVSTVDGASGGIVTSEVEVPKIMLGNPVQSGELEFYIAGSLSPAIRVSDFAGQGAGFDFSDENGAWIGGFEPDFNGDGGYFYVAGGNGYFEVDGYTGGLNCPRVTISGTGSSVVMNTNNTGDASVSLPVDAVSSIEIMNESGIAQGIIKSGSVFITGETSAMVDVVTVTIDIPSNGYVVLEAAAQAALSGTTSGNFVGCQIDKTAGGIYNDYYYFVGMSQPPNTVTMYFPVAMRRTYYEASSGSKTYRFEAMDATGNGAKYLWNPVITATFVPTSYGTVNTLASSSEAAQFESAELAVPGSNGVDEQRGAEASYVVDLRELELKALKARAAAAEAERDLAEAERQQQAAGRPNQR